MSFTISGLPADTFNPLFALSDEDLKSRNIVRQTADAKPGYPCRISLEDAEPGETVLLLNHQSHTGPTPYESSYAIFVRETAPQSADFKNELAPVMRNRPISLRLFNTEGMLIGADMGMNAELKDKIETAFQNDCVAYIHSHNSMHGCFVAEINRA